MVNLSFSTLSAPFYSIDEIIDMAVDNRYDGVELRFVTGRSDLIHLPEFSESLVDTTRQRFEMANLALPCVGTSLLIESSQGPEFTALLEEARSYAALAERLGSPLIRVFAGPPVEESDPEHLFQDIGNAISLIATAIEPYSVRLAVETHGTLSRAEDLAKVLSFSSVQTIGVVWDLMHTLRNGESLEDSAHWLGPRISHVHLRDALSMADDKAHDFVAMGEGAVPAADFMRLLKANHFGGFVSFEWEKFWMPALAEPEVVIPQFASYMRSLA
ncbi:hypothetical protein B7R22_18010 [Subtercola boreus]|uniref:Xylose isomerase-like TIM barrel domain-containing protein n=1 Tax=Subtercola boreus TaxID=120213 RepID=A0A3E0VQ21_9MICO|nr:sugar phosphate isomerase/epimerase family protein [Subtercola boreus]RFA11745.1 hypothetical protein B7R22_18010 [Subtercola boreus]